MSDQLKEELHQFVRQSDLLALKAKIDQLQGSIIDYDDPSLVLLAIEIYLNPSVLLNQHHQLEIILLLLKTGLKLWVPNGQIFAYLIDKCEQWVQEDSDECPMPVTEEQLEEELIRLVDSLLASGWSQILLFQLPEASQMACSHFQTYVRQHQAALSIQSWWRSYWTRQQLRDQDQDQDQDQDYVFQISSQI